MLMCQRKVQNCVVRDFTVLKHITIVRIKLTNSRIFNYCEIVLERNPSAKQGTTAL